MHQGAVRFPVRPEPRAVACPKGARGLSQTGEITGIVLAGGGSTRFGRDKLREPYRGAPLLHHAISAVAQVCAEVIVVGPPAGPDPDLPADAPVRLVRDPVGGDGPLAGLAAGLAGTRTRLALVAGGDMPGLSRDVLLRMLEEAVSQPVQAVALRVGADVPPLPLVVSVGRAARAATALLDSGERRLGALLDVLQLATVDEPVWRALDPRGQTFRDVDVPADLER